MWIWMDSEKLYGGLKYELPISVFTTEFILFTGAK